jgi:hypothetical protein
MTGLARDALSPREIADLVGFSYHAVLRAIRRGDLEAFEPVPGRLRIEVSEYHRWLHTPTRRPTPRPRDPDAPRPRPRNPGRPADPGSWDRLQAIEAGQR